VTVGPKAALHVDRITATGPIWTSGTGPRTAADVTIQFRAHGEALPATLTADGERVTLALAEPAYGVAPGQTVAFYDGTRVLGSATIT
jgi:tRNA-specific 2-thiouridylase